MRVRKVRCRPLRGGVVGRRAELGKLIILKLRADWRRKAGASFDLRAFRDRWLSYGDAPLPLIRRAMLGDDRAALL